MEGPDGNEVVGIVRFGAAASHEVARAIAKKVVAGALDRICFFHDTAIDDAEITGDELSPRDGEPGVLVADVGAHALWGAEVAFVVGLTADGLKTELEQAAPPGERHFPLFRSALQSSSPVEAFMHLYNLLLMLLNDSQANVDAFVRSEDPAVPQTPSPDPRKPGVMETVYTRLRNELAHPRAGVDLQDTKKQMAERLGELRTLTKHAIESQP